MTPAPAAILPPKICMTPKLRRWRYSIGLIRRCRPGRGGVSHHLRRRFAAVLSLGAFIGMPPAECGVGHPITYQRDITLIAGLSTAAVLTVRAAEPDPCARSARTTRSGRTHRPGPPRSRGSGAAPPRIGPRRLYRG